MSETPDENEKYLLGEAKDETPGYEEGELLPGQNTDTSEE